MPTDQTVALRIGETRQVSLIDEQRIICSCNISVKNLTGFKVAQTYRLDRCA